MIKLTAFAQKVLDTLEPDPEKQQEWLRVREIAPVSEAKCVTDFTDRIKKARDNHEKVLVAGDYDADGILSTSIMTDGLEKFGIETGYYIPDRIQEGYGLKKSTVQKAHDKGYSLIVTVDNGVVANEAVAWAKLLGMDVIVTDHHKIPENSKLQADILVHPDRMEEDFASLCGAGVAYECMRALGVSSDQHLQWAAVATIADCMPVRKENRAIIMHGLEAMEANCDPHLSALLKDRKINETSVAFQIVPRINSIGRLSNMANANTLVRYFRTPDYRQVGNYAAKMDELNTRRKQMSDVITALARSRLSLARPVLMASDDSFHEGIIGLAAGSISAEYEKPAIVACKCHEGCKGSMRAPEGFNCMEFLEPFGKFEALGGHKQAAGFTISPENWPAFKKYVFEQGLKTSWTPEEKKLIPITEEEITLENAESLDLFRPFGKTFEAPKFVIENPKIVSVFDLMQGKHRKFTLAGGKTAMNFNQSESDMKASVLKVKRFIGTLDVNVYQGRKSPNFIIEKIEYE